MSAAVYDLSLSAQVEAYELLIDVDADCTFALHHAPYRRPDDCHPFVVRRPQGSWRWPTFSPVPKVCASSSAPARRSMRIWRALRSGGPCRRPSPIG